MLMSKWNDRMNPMELHAMTMMRLQEFKPAPPAAQMFGGAGREYRWKYGMKKETFARSATSATSSDLTSAAWISRAVTIGSIR